MRAAFGPALPVGTAGEREYYDLWLTGYIPPPESLERLRCSSVKEIAPFRVGYVSEAGPSLSAMLTIATYEATVETAMGPQGLSDAMEAVVGTGELVVERKGKTKVFDLTEALPKRPEVSSRQDEVIVSMTIRMSPAGSLRPERLIRAALQETDAPSARILVTRTDLLVEEGNDWRPPLD
jgi:radical SAM-linked protein